MKIALIASHSWPLPSPARTGESQILLDLTRTLAELGHDVMLFAPHGTTAPEGVTFRPMLCSHGLAEPTSQKCEEACIATWGATLAQQDIIHDCGVTKGVAEWALRNGQPTISSHWGGTLTHPNPPRNIVAQSYAQRDRLLRGASDYLHTATPDMGGPDVAPIADAEVVYPGIQLDSYRPSGREKQDFFLWLNRWHPVKGYREVIALAKHTGINLLLAGEDPERDHPYQGQCAIEAVELARGCDNIQVEFLPADPEHNARKVELFSDARCLLYQTLFQEPFGLCQIEALACGTPVIGPNRGSVPEVLNNNAGPIALVVGRDVESWEEAVGRVDELDPVLCRAEAERRFGRMTMAKNYLQLYQDVIDGGWG